MRYVVAVSGGVDSVVLLDMIVKKKLAFDGELIVAHFDHGIRADSAEDMRLVHDMAIRLGLHFETKREELGEGVSEELARERRYAFLRGVAQKHSAVIVTAHHADDVVETIAINLTRGTGWRGLAVLDSPGIERPLLGIRKQELIAYANEHQLQWREDATNSDTRYLRNALRQRLAASDDDLIELTSRYRTRQVALKRLIDTEAAKLVGNAPYSRYFLTTVAEREALELLRTLFVQETGASPTIPQRRQALIAIKTYAAGSRYDVAKGITLTFSRSTFVVGE